MSDKKRLRLVYIDPAELNENPANWRRHPESQKQALADVIAEVGWAGAALYNERTKRLIDGHARKELFEGRGKIPVLIGSWTEEQERKILATLDPIAALATADPAALDALLKAVSTDSPALQALLDDLGKQNPLVGLEPACEDVEPQIDHADELRKKWKVKAGQLWELGGHRLLCGDSTKAEDVERVMGGEKAEVCFTSPPYAQQRDYTKKIDDWDGLMQGVFANLPMTDDGQVLVNLGLIHADGEWIPYWEGWIEWMRAQGWRRFGWYVWDQGFGLPGDWNGRFAPSHEFVFHFTKSALRPIKATEKKPENVRVRTGSTMRDADGSLKDFSSPAASAQPTKIADSVIRVNRVNTDHDIDHPARFPVGLPAVIMQSWDGLCFDPFLGSGTTLIAAEPLNRRCFAIEISPAYVAVALERWAEASGKTPKLTKETLP